MANPDKGQVLQRLASIDPLQLCSEARQGVRDSTDGVTLYRQCVAARLLAQHGGAAVGRGYGAEEAACLHGLFDVALANGLAALVSHYVTEVCMDASVVSSDAIETKLLDGSIVQRWAEKTLQRLLRKLQDIYTGAGSHSDNQSAKLSSVAGQLRGLSHVLDALQRSVADALSSAQEHLQDLKETLLKALQHAEIFSWCLQQRWLDHHRPQHSDASAWVAAFHKRKEAATNRYWPPGAEPNAERLTIDANEGEDSGASDTPEEEEGAPFVEEALDHLGLAELQDESEPASWLTSLAQDGGLDLGVSAMDADGGQDVRLYPPPSLRGAVDLLFLRGWASEFLAKKAIFLYYLYDRFWGNPANEWQAVVLDYCTAFHLPDFFRVECLVFFLLDHESPEALREACRLLPQIAGPKLHPRIPQVLLERGAPQDALNVLRASGRLFTLSQSPRPLDETITALRASLACGPLSEAYLLQHNHWAGLRAALDAPPAIPNPEESLEDPPREWREEMDVLVMEVVNFAVRRGVLRELVELPWAPEEESPLETALVRCAERDPGGPAGSHLVVYYLLRCRYAEAMIRHRDVCRLEDNWEGGDETRRRRAVLARQQRTSIVDASYQLLPEAERRLLEQQLAHPEPPPQPMGSQHFQEAPPVPPPLPASAPSLLFPLLPSRQPGPCEDQPTRLTNTAATWNTERGPDGPSDAGGGHQTVQMRPEEGRTEDDVGQEDADYSPRPRRLLYDEVGGSGAVNGGGETTPEPEEDEPVFHSPLGRFTPERQEPANGRAQNGEDELQIGTGPRAGVATGGKLREGGSYSGRWDGGGSPSLAGGGPFMSPVAGGPQPRRGRQATPAARAVGSARVDGGSPGSNEEEIGAGNGLGLWADGRPGPPPTGSLLDDADVADYVDDEPVATPRFISNGKSAGLYAQASPTFQLPDPPRTSNAGHTPAFLRKGGAMRWRTEEDLEDGYLDEAVASALTPGIKRPKSGPSTSRSKKVLRPEMRLL